MKQTLPANVSTILKTLSQKGFSAYVVGGSVRDMLLGRETKDWDFTTNATPTEIVPLFPDAFYENTFGTVGVPLKHKDGTTAVVFEITTYRTEHGYSDHRRPDTVSWGKTLDEDLARRDFTINAIAFDGKTLFDPFDGQTDIKNKHIRAVGNAEERFSEDALRMMRAVRQSCELGFSIEEKTFLAIKKHSELITHISKERIRDELLRLLASDHASEGILLLKDSGLLEYILPEISKCFGVEQKSPERHHIYDVGTHLIMSLKHAPSKDPIVRFATLLHDVGKPLTAGKTDEGVLTFYNHEIIGASIARNICDRLKFSKKDREKVFLLVRYHQFTVDEDQTDKALRRFIKNIGRENIEDMLALRIGDRLGGGARETSWRLELFKKRLIEVQKKPFSVSDLKVNGNDVMKIYGIGPGPLVGAVLEMIFTDVIEEKLKNDRKILLQRIEDLKKESKIGEQ